MSAEILLALNHAQRRFTPTVAVHGVVLAVAQASGSAQLLLANPNTDQTIAGASRLLTIAGSLSVATDIKLGGTSLEPRINAATSAFALGNNDWSGLVYSGTVPTYDAADQGMSFTVISQVVKIRVRMPVDPDSTYHCRVRIKKVLGNGSVYVGAVSLDNSFAELATDLASSWNYFAASNVTIAAGNTQTVEGTISGYNLVSENNHNKFDPEAKYFDLVMILNYNGTGGQESIVEAVELYRVPSKLLTQASTATNAGFNLPHGAAPTTPVNGDVWTTTGGTFVRTNGVTQQLAHLSANTFTAKQTYAASAAGAASINIPHGTAPTTPVNGDLWTTTAGVFARVNGVTVDLTPAAAGVTSFNTRTGAVTLTSTDVTDALTFTPANKAGDTFTGTVILPAATTSIASLRVPHGVAPTTPTNGDMWSTTSGLLVRINGATVTLADANALNGSNITVGTVPDGRLSTNVVLENQANTYSGASSKQTFIASSTTAASINLPHGAAPTTPANGDVWTTTAGMLVRINGTTEELAVLSTNTFTGTQIMPAATTSLASLRIPHGVAPTTPTNGDVWTTTSSFNARINGVTKSLLFSDGNGSALTNVNAVTLNGVADAVAATASTVAKRGTDSTILAANHASLGTAAAAGTAIVAGADGKVPSAALPAGVSDAAILAYLAL